MPSSKRFSAHPEFDACEETPRMSETIVDVGDRHLANLTALRRELADLAMNARKENRPPEWRPSEL
jgi:hypothetical protein